MQSSPDWKVGFLKRKILKLRSGWKSRWMFEKPRQFAHVQRGDGEGEEGGRSKDKKGERTKKGGERTSKANLVEVTLHKRESNKSSSSSPQSRCR